jgi:hypothetical protein
MMGLPFEFTNPVSGPWQERQSSAASSEGAKLKTNTRKLKAT